MNEANETEATPETATPAMRFDHEAFRAAVSPTTAEESRAAMAAAVANEPQKAGFVSEEADILDGLFIAEESDRLAGLRAARLALLAEVKATYPNPKDRGMALKQRWYEAGK